MKTMISVLRENAFYILLFGLIAVGFLVLRTTAAPVASLEELDALLRGGKPSLIELYRNT